MEFGRYVKQPKYKRQSGVVEAEYAAETAYLELCGKNPKQLSSQKVFR